MTSCDVNDINTPSCYSAISSDGGTAYALAKGAHIDAPFQTLSNVQSVSSASLFYDSWGSLSGTWAIYVKNVRDGSIICQIEPAPENTVETRNSINCNTITPTQLQNGLWLQVNNKDAGSPQNINLDYFFLQVDYVQPSNVAPTIVSVTPISPVNPTPGGATTVAFQFTAEDSNGATNLNDLTASGSFSKTGENTRNDVDGCSFVSQSGNQRTYSCSINMQYYDDNGVWTITVSIQDQAAATATNSANTFTYNLLRDITISPASFSFPSSFPGDSNLISISDTTVTNNGNADSTNTKLQITSNSLTGSVNPLESIPAGNFKAVGSSQAATVCTTGTILSNALAVDITSASITRGALDGNLLYTDNTETLRYCLTSVPTGISAQSYTANSVKGNQWVIGVVQLLAVVIIKRRKKQNKAKANLKKNIGEPDAVSIFSKAIQLSKIVRELNERYGLDNEKIIQMIGFEQENVPVTIFNKKLGALEALCRYMKDYRGKSYSEIAKLLNRDQRTIWSSYNNSRKKYPGKFLIEKSRQTIPIGIFKDSELTILESLIFYLKETELKYSEISKIIKRDQRNIRVVYLRAKNKFKIKNKP